jgi:hypothetical protein
LREKGLKSPYLENTPENKQDSNISCLTSSQIWFNPLVDDCESIYITKLGKKTPLEIRLLGTMGTQHRSHYNATTMLFLFSIFSCIVVPVRSIFGEFSPLDDKKNLMHL